MKKDVMILTGAGQIGMAIARRTGFGMRIFVGDKNLKNAQVIVQTMINAGFDAVALEVDISSRESILNMISEAKKMRRNHKIYKRSRSLAKSGFDRNHFESRFVRHGCFA